LIGTAIGILLMVMVGPVVLRDGTRYGDARTPAFAFDAQGIQVDIPPDPGTGVTPVRRFVAWAEVGDIEGSWGEAEPYRAVSDAVDRAEVRLARGDVSGARALLEPLSDRYLGQTGPTSGAIASMLAFCRVLRSEPAAAATAWLAWRRGVGPERRWIDPETSLMPSLPPVWRARDARGLLLSLGEPSTLTPAEDPAAQLVRMYAMAASVAAGEDVGSHDGPETRLRADPGVRFVWEMVRAQADPEPAGRRGARDALLRRGRTPGPAWQSAWVHLGVGVSLLREPDRIEADAGAAELLTVVLLHQHTAPGLADLAADLAVEYFERTGRAEHAEAVRTMDMAALSGWLPAAPPTDDAAGDETDPMTEPSQETP
jgi:hypothetical protein